MRAQPLIDNFENKRSEILKTIEELVSRESPSSDKARLDLFADLLGERLHNAGATVDIVPCPTHGNHICARLAHDDASAKPALILCHYDTVWPVGSLETHPFRIDDEGKAYGPGIFDMKSSLALVEYALRALTELDLRLPRPVTLLVTSDEEIGSPTSRALIEQEAAKDAAYVLVLESPLPGGVLKTPRKGVGRFTLEVIGRAAHAGVEPEKGLDAVQELAHQVLQLHAFSDYGIGTTVNVGMVLGEYAPNVVAARAVAEIDVRAWTGEEMDRVTHLIRGLQPATPGLALHVAGQPTRPPLEHNVTQALFERVRTIGQSLGLDLQEGSTGGGSDACWSGALGIPTLDGLGVPGHGAHADHEHIEVDSISSRAALLTACLLEL